MDNQDELQELDLEAIMREFHDPSKDTPSEEPETDPEPVQDAEPAEVPEETNPKEVSETMETPEEELALTIRGEYLAMTKCTAQLSVTADMASGCMSLSWTPP